VVSRSELTVVVPVYNEKASIEKTVLEINRRLPKATILAVNDGSKDSSLKILSGLKKKMNNLIVINHAKNKGYGAALKTGFINAKTEYIAFLDADLTYDPKYIKTLLKEIKTKNLDCVWCDRFSGRNKMPPLRKIGNRMLQLSMLFFTARWVNDVSSGERLFRRKVLMKLNPETLPDGLDTITALTKRIVKRKLKYNLLPIDYKERSGSSKLNIFKDFLRMLKNIIVEK
jgi:glycosyltransferase involved in cell wall biosynthesis